MSSAPLLSVRNLVTTFRAHSATVRAVDGVSFDVPEGTTVALVGESGCGKSVTSLSILRLVPDPPGRIEGGSILFRDRDLLTLSEREMRSVRGDQISMIFQEPMTSLNPVYTVGSQIVEAIRLHRDVSRPTSAPSRCCDSSAFRPLARAPAPTRTSCPVARASA
jgi:ABC-type dipeptide/oligopeptide/nickel transport system ATPase component